MVALFNCFVGSKQYWLSRLPDQLKNQDYIEPFCGSAAISINFAKTAILNDIDPMICKIISNFDKLEVPEVFTSQDYFIKRKDPEWWKYVYPMQSMCFSGVFRYSKNGYNVPIKKNCKEVKVRKNYEEALARWKELRPVVTNRSYLDIPKEEFENRIVLLDPPYQNSKANYNSSNFNYLDYWNFVDNLQNFARTILLFDRLSNLQNKNIPIAATRKMRVNGKRPGDVEALAIFHGYVWLTTLDF